MIRPKIILASASPRRKELLASLLDNFGLKFKVIPANIHEKLPSNSVNPGKLACRLSMEKADFVAKKHKGIIIGADTIVVLNEKILGKPVNKSDARKMLTLLSGRSHYVYTGLSIVHNRQNKIYNTFEMTIVKFRKITSNEIEFYVNSGSPFDKAGSYGIQDDFGSTFVSAIKGDFFNVVGLPVVKTYLGLKKFIELG